LKKFRVAIIGAGPAGISTAIQLKRYKIPFIIFEKKKIGGIAINANLIENYPGFYKGIKGTELIKFLKKHLEKYEINPLFEEVKNVDYIKEKDIFLIQTDKRKIHSEILVIASGTKPKKWEYEEKLSPDIRKRIYYQVINLKRIKNKRILIIGAGEIGFDYALTLCRKNEIFILNRGKKINVIPVLKEEVLKNKKTKYFDNSEVLKIEKKDKTLKVIFKRNNKLKELFIDYILIAIGRIPEKSFYSENLKKCEDFLIKKEKLFLTGDVKKGIFRQVSIAAGDGIETAMRIYLKIKNLK